MLDRFIRYLMLSDKEQDYEGDVKMDNARSGIA
jgi:hypothetical protein